MAAKKKTAKKAAAKKPAAKKAAVKKSAPGVASKRAAKKSAKPAAKEAKTAAPRSAAESREQRAESGKPRPHHTSLANFLSPLDDRIVIEPDAAETKTAGGLFLAGTTSEGPARGTVLAKGPGHRNKKGKLRPLDVQVGDKVVYSEYAGTKLNFANAKVLILREEDILGIVE